MENKLTEKEIFEKLKSLKEKDVMIHVSIKDGRLKVENAESRITSVYPFFVCVESEIMHYMETFTIKLVDIAIGKVKIKELE